MQATCKIYVFPTKLFICISVLIFRSTDFNALMLQVTWYLFVVFFCCCCFLENGGTIFAKSGSFHSPNYPSPYPVSRDRVWIITTERNPNSSLTLFFDKFSVGRNDGTGICKDDYLDIRNGKGFLSQHIIQLCGNEKPDPITVLSESIYVRLHSTLPIHKSAGLKKGFSVRFQTNGEYVKYSRNVLRKII